MKESMSALKSYIGHKDDELKFLTATLLEHQEAYFCLERKHTALAQDRDKLLVKFDTHVEATETSKHEIIANPYKLGYLDCRNGASSCCPLEDDDGEEFYLDLPPVQSEQVNVVDVEAVEEHVTDEAALEEDNARVSAADEPKADAKEQVAKVAEHMVLVGQSETVASAVRLAFSGDEACHLRAYVGDITLEKGSIDLPSMEIRLVSCVCMSGT
ncbi:unnamed protein product [Prunus brigantina]